jgi:uncharacterized membrane protein HdeD (DUF308 family)
MTFAVGIVYTFTLSINPTNGTYTASILNGVTTVNSGTLGFNTNSYSVDGILNFAVRTLADHAA